MKSAIIFLGSVGLMLGCDFAERPDKEVNEYLDIDSLFKAQVHAFDEKKPQLKKIIRMGDKEEEQIRRPDSAAWAVEMEGFFEMDINKSNLRGLYEKSSFEREGLSILHYQSKKEDLSVQEIEFSFSQKGLPKHFVGRKRENRYLYSLDRQIDADFDEEGFLKSYEIRGMQKVVLLDTIPYLIKAELIP